MPRIKIFILITFLIFSFFVFGKAEAGSEHNVSGWAWSENVGWISFNSTNCDHNNDGLSDGTIADCPSAGTPMADYGVNINPSSGVFSGYAWSENIGWITFNTGELTGCPIAPCQAKLEFSTKKVSGWAKVLSHDGISWPTWIRLRGQTTETPPTDYGVWWNPDDLELKGWAWGDVGLGWTSFNCENCEGTTCGTYPTCDNPAHPDYKVIANLDIFPPTVGPISPNIATVNVSTNFSTNVSDNVEVTNCWLYIYGGGYGEFPGTNAGEMTLSTSPCPSCTASKNHTFNSIGQYFLYAFCLDGVGNAAAGPPVEVTVSGFFCNVNVQNTALINQTILIDVSGSQGAIATVRFSSDNNLNGSPDRTWDGPYDWNTSSGNWDATNKTMKWSFAATGNYEVWAEVKDGAGNSKSCYDTILIMECYPGQTKTCTSPQGCSHTITCQPSGTWPSCPVDSCSPGSTQSCDTNGTQICTENCTWGTCVFPPPGGECPWPPLSCPICQHPECNTVTGVWECQPDTAGTDCGDCKECNGAGNCNPVVCSSPYCECIADSCIICSDYYGSPPGYGFCEEWQIPIWSCVNGKCQYDCAGTPPPGCTRKNPEVYIVPDPPWYGKGDPGDSITYTVEVWNKDEGTDCPLSSTFDLTTGDYCSVTGWTCSALPELTIDSNNGHQSTTLTVTSPSQDVSSGNYDISVTALNLASGLSGTGYTTYVIPNQPPSKPTPSDGNGVTWTHCTGFAGVSLPTFHWNYSDPEGDSQQSYQIEIKDVDHPEKSLFTDSQNSSSPSYTPSTIPWREWMNSDPKSWNTNCKWRVKVKDNQGNWSDWSAKEWKDATSFTTPLHAAPYPDFSPSKVRVSQNEKVTFIDSSECYTSEHPEGIPSCQGLNVTYEWDFDYDIATGGFATDKITTPGNITHSYSARGTYYVKLRIKDNTVWPSGEIIHCDSETKTITVTLPLPRWWEIAPF
jgi:hypothetical protein